MPEGVDDDDEEEEEEAATAAEATTAAREVVDGEIDDDDDGNGDNSVFRRRLRGAGASDPASFVPDVDGLVPRHRQPELTVKSEEREAIGTTAESRRCRRS